MNVLNVNKDIIYKILMNVDQLIKSNIVLNMTLKNLHQNVLNVNQLISLLLKMVKKYVNQELIVLRKSFVLLILNKIFVIVMMVLLCILLLKIVGKNQIFVKM